MTHKLESRLQAAGRPDIAASAAVAAARLARRASENGEADIAYTTIDSPLGPLLAAASRRGLLRLAYHENGRDEVLERIAARVSPRIVEAPRRLDAVARELDQYFAGRLREFGVALDWQLVRGDFGRRVLEATARIPFGASATYADVATEACSPRAVRAAGNALGANPLPIIVPCHRVLRTGGGLGGYTGGLEKKQLLLSLEGVARH